MKKYNWITVLLIISTLFGACKQKSNDKSDSSEPIEWRLPDWAKNATIYEANVRHLSPKGNIAGLEDQLQRLKDMHIDIIWLMPIHPISELKRKATGDTLVVDIPEGRDRSIYLGSPYSVADYRAINPDFGTMDDFKRLVRKAHDLDMKIIIDWVPNHTGWDHAWVTDHPEWYTKDKDGNITDPINDNGEKWGWTDVAELNFDNQDMRKAMQEALLYWVEEADIDGYRMDVAHGIPQDFWDETSPLLVAAKPDIFLLAESEVPSHRNNNTFHATYGWTFHHLLNEIARGHKNAKDIDKYTQRDDSLFQKGFHMHFTSNHDENAWAGPATTRMGEAHKCMAVLEATIDGMPLLYSGMEEPIHRKLKFFEKDTIEFENYAYADFYKELFEMKHTNHALWNGEYGGQLERIGDDENVFAFQREKDDHKIMAIFNLSSEKQKWILPMSFEGQLMLSGQSRDFSKGTELSLAPWEYLVFNTSN